MRKGGGGGGGGKEREREREGVVGSELQGSMIYLSYISGNMGCSSDNNISSFFKNQLIFYHNFNLIVGYVLPADTCILYLASFQLGSFQMKIFI